MAGRDDGYIVNIGATEMFGTRGAAVDAAITHAIVGLSASLYRELDSMGFAGWSDVSLPRARQYEHRERSRIPEFRPALDALRSVELPATRRGCRANLRCCRRAALPVL
jgi:hypothetical protein